MTRLRRRVFEWLEPGQQARASEHVVDAVVVALIFTSVTVVILESLPGLAPYDTVLQTIEAWCVYLFSAEYVLRVWSCVEKPRFQEPVRGRLRYMRSGMALIDLIAILPFYIAPFAAANTVVFRLFRLARLVRILKIARYNESLTILGRIVRARKEDLLVSLALVITLILVSSTLMYAFEHEAQPNVFSSIPASMWWGVVTLTTVGYGDTYPITPGGKVVAGFALLLGIGLFALPAGILASAFTDEMQRARTTAALVRCPHCGKSLTGDGGSAAGATGA